MSGAASYRGIQVSAFGGPSVLKLSSAIKFMKDLTPSQVRVKVMAAAVNPVETYIRAGTHRVKPKLPYTPGNDGAGIVEAIGSNVTNVSVGDRVYISKSVTGTYAEASICENSSVHALPNQLSFEQGAAISTAYLTAYRALIQRGSAKPLEKVLIHGASGGVGIAAVQLCQMLGMRTFGTASSEQGRAVISKQGVPGSQIFNHADPTQAYMKQLTEEHGGVDVILEMLANANLSKDLSLLTKNGGGRVMVIGNRGTTEINPRDTMNTEGDIRGVYLPLATPQSLSEAHAALCAGFISGALSPVVSKVLPLEDASVAHTEVMQAGAAGKIILRCSSQ